MPEAMVDPITAINNIIVALNAVQVPIQVLNGQVIIAAPRVPLAAVATPIKSVSVTNLTTNAIAYIGNATVTAANGDFLLPGMTKSLDIDDLNKVYVTGTAGNVVSYIAVN